MNVDGILVVNLDSRPERWALFQESKDHWIKAFETSPQRFPAVAGISLDGYDKPPWFRARIKDRRRKSWAGKAGAILSHRNAIHHAKEQGWNCVLILEDDAFLTEEMADLWKVELESMVVNLPKDWAVVYFYSAKPFSPFRIVSDRIGARLIEAAGAFGCVAYLLNCRIYDRLLQELPTEKTIWPWVARYKAIDLWLSNNLRRFGRVYAVAPSLVGHRVGPSDITMTPESEWTFDGEMKGLAYTGNPVLFGLKKTGRSIEGIYQELISLFRLGIKRLRGL
ncbi:MAG: hypothetical protein GXY61_10470 [Lentisphaerae bacterium]|nr:hypothetical protein [Lentisphaerota bacterium]